MLRFPIGAFFYITSSVLLCSGGHSQAPGHRGLAVSEQNALSIWDLVDVVSVLFVHAYIAPRTRASGHPSTMIRVPARRDHARCSISSISPLSFRHTAPAVHELCPRPLNEDGQSRRSLLQRNGVLMSSCGEAGPLRTKGGSRRSSLIPRHQHKGLQLGTHMGTQSCQNEKHPDPDPESGLTFVKRRGGDSTQQIQRTALTTRNRRFWVSRPFLALRIFASLCRSLSAFVQAPGTHLGTQVEAPDHKLGSNSLTPIDGLKGLGTCRGHLCLLRVQKHSVILGSFGSRVAHRSRPGKSNAT